MTRLLRLLLIAAALALPGGLAAVAAPALEAPAGRIALPAFHGEEIASAREAAPGRETASGFFTFSCPIASGAIAWDVRSAPDFSAFRLRIHIGPGDPSGLDWEWNDASNSWAHVEGTPWVKPPPRGLTPAHLGGDTYYNIIDHIQVYRAVRGLSGPVSPDEFAARVKVHRDYWATMPGGAQVVAINLAYAAWDPQAMAGDAKAGEGMWARHINDQLDDGRWFVGGAQAISYATWNTFSIGRLGATDRIMAARTQVDNETFWQLADANTKAGAKDAAIMAVTLGAGAAVQSGRAALVWTGQAVNAGFVGYAGSAAVVDVAHGEYKSGALNAGLAALAAYGLRPAPRGPRPVAFDDALPAGAGETSFAGRVTVSPHGTMADIKMALAHENVHAALSAPSPLRAGLKGWAYNHSSLLRYTEEALAETVAQLQMRAATGRTVFGAIREGVRFPLVYDYGLSASRIWAEAAGIGVGVGGAAVVGGAVAGGD